jgi:preprotein translocase subunit SecA
MVSRAIERAQKQVESQNFSIRKHLLEYDDVMNKQRAAIYSQRKDILHGKDLKEYFAELVETILDWLLDTSANKEKPPDEWDRDGLKTGVFAQFALDVDKIGIAWETVTHEELRERIVASLRASYEDKEKLLGPDRMRDFERMILLQVIDSQWKDHLLEMDHLKEGIGLRGYGQRDPLVEYKKEGYEMFQAMMDRIEEDALRYLFLIQPAVSEEAPQQPVRRERPLFYQRSEGGPERGDAPKAKQARSTIPGRKRKR